MTVRANFRSSPCSTQSVLGAVVRVWEHEAAAEAARRIADVVGRRRAAVHQSRRTLS